MAKAIINTARNQGKISKYIYGQFAEHLGRCIYEGLYVDENSDIPNKNGMRCDVVNALKELEIPVLRWPGGCFADDYHWRDGIGEKWLIQIGAVLSKTTTSVHTNFLSFANSSEQSRTYAEMSAAVLYRKCVTGLNI